MVVQQIIRSCSNMHVAHAAVISIGGDFAEHLATEELRWDLPSGMLAALIVREFSARADDDQRARVRKAAHDADQPILSGLRYILLQSALLR
jgi:hypothetical protein